MNKIFMLLVIFVSAISGCSKTAEIELAELGVKNFHAMLNAGRFEEIYEAASEDTRKVLAKDEFVRFIGTVHRKFGKSGASHKIGRQVEYSTSGTFITLHYSTKYDHEEIEEIFKFLMDEKKGPLLYSYLIPGNEKMAEELGVEALNHAPK